MRKAAVPLALALLLLLAFSQVAFAYDDSSSTDFSQTSTVNPQLQDSTLSQMAGTNDSQLTSLLSALNASQASGDSSQVSSSLANLQAYASNSAKLKSLLADMNSSLSSGGSLNSTMISQLQSLASSSNDPTLQSLASSFASSYSSGNRSSALSALSNLQSYTSSKGGSPAFDSLVKSLFSGKNGITLNPSALSSFMGLGSLGSNGVPSNLVGMDPAQLFASLGDMQNLLKNIDPSMAAQMLNSMATMSGPGGLDAVKGFKLPSGLSSPTGGGLPSFSVQNPAGAGAIAGGAGVGLEPILLVASMVAAAVVLFLFRGKIASLFRGQALPGEGVVADIPDAEYDPKDARKRVIFAFSGVVRTMGTKGVIKERSDTSREFSAKCAPRPEAGHVTKAGGLYEVAKFSNSEVHESDAAAAESELSAVQGAEQKK